jgi:hypothetical protein
LGTEVATNSRTNEGFIFDDEDAEGSVWLGGGGSGGHLLLSWGLVFVFQGHFTGCLGGCLAGWVGVGLIGICKKGFIGRWVEGGGEVRVKRLGK